MARLFIAAHPPSSPLMMFYGDGFADFIASFEAARDLSYLADVARLEAARTRAYHAEDAMPLEPSVLQSVGAEELGHLHVKLHPSVEIVSSAFPIVTIFAMHMGDTPLDAITDWHGEAALVVRPHLDVDVFCLPPGGAYFLEALGKGNRWPKLWKQRSPAKPASTLPSISPCSLAPVSPFLFRLLHQRISPHEPIIRCFPKAAFGLASIDRASHRPDGHDPAILRLALRTVFPAAIFWLSGETKVDGFHLKDSAVALFREEYALPLIDPTIAATMAAFAEHFFPVLLIIGFASRFAALALLGMTAVIEIFVYPDAWPLHGVWTTCFLVVIARGPGAFSLDHLIARHYGLAK